MSLPDPAFSFRIEHPAKPGQVFDVAHTEAQATSKLERLLQLHDGFVIAPNVAGSPAVVPAVEVSPPDTLTLWLDELVQSEGSRDAAYKFLFDHLVIAKEHLHEVQSTQDALLAKSGETAEPTPPPACPFEPGNLIADKHSGTQAVVDVVDDTAGVMQVLLEDRTTHKVPAINYTDFELVEKSAPKGFFVAPKPKKAPAPEPVPEKPRRSTQKIEKRNPADLLKQSRN